MCVCVCVKPQNAKSSFYLYVGTGFNMYAYACVLNIDIFISGVAAKYCLRGIPRNFHCV